MANPTPSKAAISTKQILVIDDDSSIREVVSICLKTLGGWNVHKASSGHEGLAIAQTKAPDIIILDVMMPGMNGFQVIERLKGDSLTQLIPIILLTANGYIAESKAISLGVKSVIYKPFETAFLVRKISDVLE